MKFNLKEICKGDRTIWWIFGILIIVSLIFIFDSTGMLTYKMHHGNTFYYLLQQSFFIIVSVGTVVLMSNFSYKHWYKFADLALGIGILLLIITYFYGEATNDAKRWIKIPFIGQTLQTSDVAKVCLTIFIAKTMGSHQSDAKDIQKGVLISSAATLVVCFLILPSNLSTALLIGFTSVILMIIARGNVKHIVIGSAGLAVVALLVIMIGGKTGTFKRAETWAHRIEAFVSIGDDTKKTKDKEENFQATQANIAVARGGLIGNTGIQKNILPHPYSDFIFSIILEEGGLLLGIGIIVCYFILMHRSVITARYQSKPFAAFLCIGLALNIVFQAIANMVVSVGLIPVTGQPLPFISLGGTSLVISSVSIGIILNISRYSDKEGKEKEKEEVEERDREENLEDVTDFPFIIG